MVVFQFTLLKTTIIKIPILSFVSFNFAAQRIQKKVLIFLISRTSCYIDEKNLDRLPMWFLTLIRCLYVVNSFKNEQKISAPVG